MDKDKWQYCPVGELTVTQGRQVAEGRHEKYPKELRKGARQLGKTREAEAGGP